MINDWQILISHIHHTNDPRQYCHVGKTAHHCRLGLLPDSDFAGDLEDSKSTSGGVLCIFESRTVVPVSWMCKKQTSVSHSSTESEIISLDAGLRLDGIPALDFWDLIEIISLDAGLRMDGLLALGKRVATASGREKISGHLCANSGRGRDIELNMSKRVEADSGLDVSGDPCTVFGQVEPEHTCRCDWKWRW